MKKRRWQANEWTSLTSREDRIRVNSIQPNQIQAKLRNINQTKDDGEPLNGNPIKNESQSSRYR